MTTPLPTPERKPDQASSRLVAAASMVLGGALTGVGLGYVIDQWLGSQPIALVICFTLFTSAGFCQLFKAAR